MDRYDALPSGRTVNTFLYHVESNGYRKAKALVGSLLKGYRLMIDTGNGLAYMNHDTKTIAINNYLFMATVDPWYDKLVGNSGDWAVKEKFFNFISYVYTGLVCHEIGHAFFTLSPAKAKVIAKNLGCTLPEYFLHFSSNVVEDSYIQHKMIDKFRWNYIRESLKASTLMFQGRSTCEEFSKQEKYTTRDKMFYFILRSYNPSFLPPDGLDIPEELIEHFLSFYFVGDMEERYTETVRWAEKMYEYLKEELTKENEEQKQQEQSSGSGQGNSSQQSSGDSFDADQALQDLVESISSETGIGSNKDKKTCGDFNGNAPKFNTVESLTLCSGITKFTSHHTDALSSSAKAVKSNYDREFQRNLFYTKGGLTFNLKSGSLNKKQLHKSEYSNKIFTKNLSTKRDMDLYCGITLDSSGSMRQTYKDLVDIVVPLVHSLNTVNAKTELLVFSTDTVKVKGYYDNNLSTLYSATKEANMNDSTELLPSLQYFYSVLRERPHKDKCIIVITDGQADDFDSCVACVKDLRKQGAYVLGLGLKVRKDSKWFSELFGLDALVYENDEAIRNNIAKDLTRILARKFMKR